MPKAFPISNGVKEKLMIPSPALQEHTECTKHECIKYFKQDALASLKDSAASGSGESR